VEEHAEGEKQASGMHVLPSQPNVFSGVCRQLGMQLAAAASTL